MIDLPAFVLLISMVKSPLILLLPSSLSPPVPFLSLYCPPPSSPLFLHLPILPPSHHSLTLMPSSPSLKLSIQSPPPPMFQVSSIYCMGSYQIFNTFLEARTGYIYRVKQIIVHVILSRSVHQITYGDVIKAFFVRKNLPAKDTSE